MKVYEKTNDGILMHSDTYLGLDYVSSNLKHWKYLKRVKSPSGKWRYIYDESEMRFQEKIHNDVAKKVNSKDGYHYIDKNGDSVTQYKDSRFKSLGSAGSKQSIKDKIKEKRYKSYENFLRQKIKDFPKRTISRGIGAINKFLLNIEKSWIRK